MTLQDHLNACYAVRVGLRQGTAEGDFVAALMADPDLVGEAEVKRAELGQVITARGPCCFVTTTQAAILDSCLAAAS